MLDNTPPTLSFSPPRADSTTLTNQLETSQQQMIRLDEAIPRASQIATQHLDYWFKRTFPALADNVSVKELAVYTRRDEATPSAERTTDGPVSRWVTDTVALDTLLWRAIAGKVDTREFFLEPDNIDIITNQGEATQMPPALNNRGAKEEIKRLINTLAASFGVFLAQALDDFWDKFAAFSQGRHVSDWLAAQFAAQLRAQADLHHLDGTLSLQMHRAVTSLALSAPDAASRARISERLRPGVYALDMTPGGWGFSVPLTSAIALTQHDDSDNTGHAVLYSPGIPLKIHGDLAALKAGLGKDDNATDKVEILPITENFLAHLVADLRTTQKADVNEVLLDGPAEGEKLSAWVARIDAAASIGDRLDLAGAMDERELQLNRKKLDDWLHGNPNVTGPDRVAWWRAVQDLQKTMEEVSPAPDPVTLATQDALQERIRELLARFIKEKHAPADPDRISLGIRKQVLDPHAPTGESPFGSGVSLDRVQAVVDDRRSMTEWAMSNLTPEERNASHVTVEGPLSFAQIVAVI